MRYGLCLPNETAKHHLVIKHAWLENGLLISDFPHETSIHRGFSIAMFDYQRVDPKSEMSSKHHTNMLDHVGAFRYIML